MREFGRSSLTRDATRITRTKARSFYLASLFLPHDVRRDTHVMYAFYRTVDDLVDEPQDGLSRQDKQRLLLEWKSALLADRSSTYAFVEGARQLASRHAIPRDCLCMVLDGALLDLDLRAVRTRDELLEYSVLVAGSVGMVMCYVLGTSDPQAIRAACDLGVAMQITNVLRDVGEDHRRGRIYLPLDDLKRCGYSQSQLANECVDAGFRNVMGVLAADARQYYASGMKGIEFLDRSVQFSIYLAATLYSRILDDIERHEFNVFTRRAGLGAVEKWLMTMPAYVHHRHALRRQA